MEINDKLVLQWEPKIQKMLSTTDIIGMDREDIAQELRIALVKSAKKFDETKGVLFHTYLHTSLVNTIRTLITKAQRIPISRSLDETYNGDNFHVSAKILQALINPVDVLEETEISLWLENQELANNEKYFLELKLKGLTMDEITVKLRHEFIKRVLFFADLYQSYYQKSDLIFFRHLADKVLDFYSSSYKVRENIKTKLIQRMEQENAQKEEAQRETNTENETQRERIAKI